MQTSKEQLIRQQQILAVKGFYHGKFDGIWSTKSIEAMREYENDDSFDGFPTNGLPFPVGNSEALPSDVIIDITNPTLLYCKGVEEFYEKEKAPEEVDEFAELGLSVSTNTTGDSNGSTQKKAEPNKETPKSKEVKTSKKN